MQMDQADDIRGGKSGVRLVDLQSWHCIRARCSTCSHVGIIDPAVVRAPTSNVLLPRQSHSEQHSVSCRSPSRMWSTIWKR